MARYSSDRRRARRRTVRRPRLQPAAGADNINLADLTVQYISGEDFANLIVDDVDGSLAEGDAHPDDVSASNDGQDPRFGIDVITAENDDDLVMTDSRDRYELVIDTSGGDDADLGPAEEGDDIQLEITTGVGAQTIAFLQVPDSLSEESDGETVSL